MKRQAVIKCSNCGRTTGVEVSVAHPRRFRCSKCGGPGVMQETSLPRGGVKPAPPRSASALPLPLPQGKQTSSAAISSRPNSKSSGASGHCYCTNCGKPIPDGRLRAVPGTKLCVDCAQNDPSAAPNRSVSEPWGSREAWKRDKARWKRTH